MPLISAIVFIVFVDESSSGIFFARLVGISWTESCIWSFLINLTILFR
jgi:hypothetical protein